MWFLLCLLLDWHRQLKLRSLGCNALKNPSMLLVDFPIEVIVCSPAWQRTASWLTLSSRSFHQNLLNVFVFFVAQFINVRVANYLVARTVPIRLVAVAG